MKHSSRIKWLIAALLVLLISTGCSLGGKESQSIDPPQDIASAGDDIWQDPLLNDVIQASAEAKIHFSLYFKDPDGYVVPVKMNFPDTESPAKEVLKHMVKGGPGEEVLPSGFSALIPEGTEVLGMNIVENGLAIVDFSKEFNQYSAADERKLLEAITWTLTGFPTINEVLIRVDGKAIEEMPVNGTPLNGPLSRTMGINLENPDGVRPTAAMPVTVYYQNQNSEQLTYLVPVTRLVEKSDDKTKALLNELIAGPSVTSGLEPVINSSVEVINVNESEGLITINFSEEFAGANQVVSQEAIETVVLSLTDNTAHDTQVQILVDGNASLQAGSDQTFDTPVSRPMHINEFSF